MKKTAKKLEPVAEVDQPKRKRKQPEEERIEQAIADELAEAGVVVVTEELVGNLETELVDPIPFDPALSAAELIDLKVHEAEILNESLTVVPEVPVVPSNKLLVFRDDGSLEPATQEDLVKIGTAMLRDIFAKPEVAEALATQTEKPPPPKIQGNHCRLCNFFVPGDSRGPLWATEGKCSAQWPQPTVEPEFYCNRFIFNEGLRDNN